MSLKLIKDSPDLKRLYDEEYGLEIRGAHVLVHGVPYVNSRKEIKTGILVSALSLAKPDQAGRPPDHVIYFIGELPCNYDGTHLQGLVIASSNQTLDAARGISISHTFSNKPPNGFNDYYEKFVSYVRILMSPAQAIDNTVNAKTLRAIESTDPNYPFKYLDTNSSRAEIVAISQKLANLKIAILGAGGTGSYVLDFVAKTPVKEIHVFDDDFFYVHNGFRAPGAPTREQLDAQNKKVKYLHEVYSKWHNFIIPHDCRLDGSNLELLAGMSFVFVCIDDGVSKKPIIEKLIALGIPFCDTGIGIHAVDNALTGSIRVTTGTSKKYDHIAERVPFADDGNNDYQKNVQIAELNALNAALAVIKWKKLFGFYHDLEKEHNAVYDLNVNKVMNDEAGS